MVNGDTKKLEILLSLQKSSDTIFTIPVFVRLFKLLLKEKIEVIFDCQPSTTAAIMLAAKMVGKIQKRNIAVYKVITEPCHAHHLQYFRPIKSLSQFLKKDLQIIAGPPLLENGDNETLFWQKTAKINKEQIIWQGEYPVRKEFLYNSYSKEVIEFSISNQSELKQLQTDFQIVLNIKENFDKTINGLLNVGKNPFIITIMLGSQGTKKATLDYVRLILENWSSDNLYIFVYVGKYKNNNLFLKQLKSFITKNNSKVKIIPLSFQPAKTLEQLFAVSDISMTRSGGATCMELLTIGKGNIFIHSDIGNPRHSGLIKHEYYNYLCLKQFHNNNVELVDNYCLLTKLKPIMGNITEFDEDKSAQNGNPVSIKSENEIRKQK